jgi:hypothetical protein
LVHLSSFSSVRTEALALLLHCHYALHSSNGLILLSLLFKLVLSTSIVIRGANESYATFENVEDYNEESNIVRRNKNSLISDGKKKVELSP